jgi:YgiT-type zinc finger domain-containing protein
MRPDNWRTPSPSPDLGGWIVACTCRLRGVSRVNACPSCKGGTLEPGTTTATFDAEGTTVVIRNIPAELCNACGEGSFDPATTEHLLELAAAAAEWSGAPVQICDYE